MRIWVLVLVSVLALPGPSLTLGQAADSTITVPDNFPTIQQAIDSASPGDTIIVRSNTYFERPVINKPLHLIGESKDSTIINGGGGEGSSPVILVRADDVEVRNLNVRNADLYGQGILVMSANRVSITNNIISASLDGDGVSLSKANNTIITDNLFQGNLYAVNVTGSSFNLIARNAVTSGLVGVQLWRSQNNTVANNTFSDGESGLDLIEAVENRILRNVVRRNSLTGAHVQNSTENLILENDFQLNRFGINIQDSPGNVFYHNNILFSSLFQVNHVRTSPSQNRWDNGTAGNYWSDYQGLDDGSGGRDPGDGIGDTGVPHDGVDSYPLMVPFVPIALFVKDLLASTTVGPAPLTVTFEAEVVGGVAPLSYHWDFGDAEAASGLEVMHRFLEPGSYMVRFRVLDDAGSVDERSLIVLVDRPPGLSPVWIAAVVLGIAGPVGLGVWFWRSKKRRRMATGASKP